MKGKTWPERLVKAVMIAAILIILGGAGYFIHLIATHRAGGSIDPVTVTRAGAIDTKKATEEELLYRVVGTGHAIVSLSTAQPSAWIIDGYEQWKRHHPDHFVTEASLSVSLGGEMYLHIYYEKLQVSRLFPEETKTYIDTGKGVFVVMTTQRDSSLLISAYEQWRHDNPGKEITEKYILTGDADILQLFVTYKE